MRATIPVLAALVAALAADAAAAAGLAGAEIAFLSKRDGDFDVWLRCPDGRELDLTAHPAQEHGFSWSPDGSRIAFSTNRDGNREIYTLELATGALENRTRHPADDVQPDWSPDGRFLAFVSDRESEVEEPSLRAELWTLELATGALRRLTRNALYDESPDWSPDGTTIAFSRIAAESDGGDADLHAIGADGTGERRLLAKPGFDSGPAWSPDGTRLLFHGRRERSMEILELELETGDVRALTDDDRDDWQPRYAADGTEVVWCTGLPPHEWDVWTMSATGESPRRIVEGPGRDEAPEPRPAGAPGGPCAGSPTP